MANSALYRHDISDHIWALLEPQLPGRAGHWGDIGKDNRKFINDVQQGRWVATKTWG